MLVEHVMGFEYLAFFAFLPYVLAYNIPLTFCHYDVYTLSALTCVSIPDAFVFAKPVKRPTSLTFATPLPWDIAYEYMTCTFRHVVSMYRARQVYRRVADRRVADRRVTGHGP